MKKPGTKVRHHKEIVIVELLDEEIIDEAATNDIAELLFSLVADKPPVQMLLNFEQVRHLGSSMLSILVMLNRRIENSQSTIKLCGINSSLRQLFSTTKTDRLFDICEDEEQALLSFGNKPPC